MNADERRSKLNGVSEKVIGAAYEVGNTLGAGFLEKVYENALAIELRSQGLDVKQQDALRVNYKGHVVGEYITDLLVAGNVIVELKAVKALEPAHMAQCMNYLKATGHHLALLINFGTPKVQIKRIVHNF